jgi:hypothetical protein
MKENMVPIFVIVNSLDVVIISDWSFGTIYLLRVIDDPTGKLEENGGAE